MGKVAVGLTMSLDGFISAALAAFAAGIADVSG